MNSTVRFRNMDTDETEADTLVFLELANIAANRLSILAPIGTRAFQIHAMPLALGKWTLARRKPNRVSRFHRECVAVFSIVTPRHLC